MGTDSEMKLTHRKKNRFEKNIYTGVPTIEYDEGRDEKPWQRVFSEVTRKGTHLYEPVKSIPCAALVLLLGSYLLLGYLTQLVEDEMPGVVHERDVEIDNSESFSEEAAQRYLNVTSGNGPRVAGTAYHLNKTRDLKELLDAIALQGRLPVWTDWQRTDGDYWLAFNPPHLNVYRNVSNVIALLEGESGVHANGSLGSTLLVNCHYDSVPYAIGTSDNMIFCAVMIETLSRLSRRQQRLKHNVVFLFNGAEENPLQGSHAFLQHAWSKNIVDVINLDAAGMNGKPIIFQVTDPRILAAYRRVVPRPSGQSIGQFLFSSGIIPSDTDFRIWRDFGKIRGMDIAFIKWGHLYHTRYDSPKYLMPGVVQNAGTMLLKLVTEVAEIEDLYVEKESTYSVYYDYLYTFLVTYSLSAALAIDIIVALFGVTSVFYYVWLVGLRWSSVQELLFSVVGRMVSMAAGIVVTAILVPISVASTTQLRYLSQPWIVVPMYWMPYVITAVCVSQLFDAWRTKRSGLNRSIRSLQAQAATRLLLSAVLLVLCCVPAVTTMRYMFTVPLLIMSVMSLVSLTLVRYIKLTAWQQLLMEVTFSLPTTMFLLSLSLKFTALLQPIMGRSHTDTPDYVIAAVNTGLAVLVSCSVSGIELLFSRKRLWVVAGPLAAVCVIVMFIPFSPYQDEGPSTQRHYWFHTEIITYNYAGEVTARSSGVLVTKHDAYSTRTVLSELRSRGAALVARTDFDSDCQRHVFCNLPLYRLRFGDYLRESLFLSTGPPAPFTPEASVRVTSKTCTGETCTFNFVMTGPPHNTLTLWPLPQVNLTSWSFSSPALPSLEHGGRPVYVIVHSTATWSEVLQPLNFTVNFIVPLSQQAAPVVQLTQHAHKIFHPEDYTPEYRSIVDAAPPYFNIASFLSFRLNYVF
ncbi:endoplasmic reticulum metallopeptidase 1-like isoform X3 [Pectinophora gossypiella]|nr:endoplasmic reticulum metallopeptidase 1-like isoform X3 [Pectinophora gossypiella]